MSFHEISLTALSTTDPEAEVWLVDADVPGAGGGEDGAEAAAHRGHLAAVAGGVASHQLEPVDIHHGHNCCNQS